MVEKKTDSPDEDKSVGDTSALVPVLQDFFSLHPAFQPDTFLGDSAFDSAFYGTLFHDFHFSKALIPYNPRNESTLKKVGYNAYGYPAYPNDSSLAMKFVVSPKKRDVQTVSNGTVQKCITIKAGSAIVKIHAALLHIAEQLTLMKTWIYVCSRVFNAIRKNGMTLTKYELS